MLKKTKELFIEEHRARDTLCKKANQRLYLIRKLKTFDVDKKDARNDLQVTC